MDLKMKGKVALVTGGASGIGEKTAEYFVQEGVKLAIADMNRERLEEKAGFLKGIGGEVKTFPCDVTNEED
ncbi:MAG TPA: SDR family NAD(P)-dependent oxidoreductase, partial [Thermodesulfobacteriota bacterium]|nr:SDR family NAD(P)-dependent oxidoreductase [Thermodesulfobacteriota bacterium]